MLSPFFILSIRAVVHRLRSLFMIHDVVEVGTPTTKAVAPISNKRHPAKTLAASVTLNKLRVNLYQGADPDLAAKLLTVMMNHVD